MKNNPNDTELIGSRIGRLDPNIVNQSGASIDDDEFDTEDDSPTGQDVTDDEPVDRDGDPTGEHDHQQDDNFYLGGHVTRSSS
ncbi:hypothetical protein [Tellurirhabdus rosea]|uniref:hypothetical protein n=1 Tax=Tellurirhabdus rosea TaxID=2674997 RepID=UPI00225C3452|nr:hypothetical protein [Tellurirhabdus rosea]